MKVLYINAIDIVGGAAIATCWLRDSLEQHYSVSYKHIVKFSKQPAYSPPANLIMARGGLWQNCVEESIDKLTSKKGYLYKWLPFSRKHILKIVKDFEPDIINLHNIHGGYFQVSLIEELSKYAPVVWSMHDMWAITGKCEYDYGCGRWESGCGECPILGDFPAIGRDRTGELWQEKRDIYQKSDLTIVVESKWMEENVKKSPLLQNKPLHRIPNCINLDTFSPTEKLVAKSSLGIDEDTPVIMFAIIAKDVYRKGYDLMMESLKILDSLLDKKVCLLSIGRGDFSEFDFQHLYVKNIGYVLNEHYLGLCYNASDVFMLPTRHDNFPLVLMQAIACGTPCVTYDVGGCGEIVVSDISGYAISPFDTEAFAEKISAIINDKELAKKLQKASREHAQNTFTFEKTTGAYYELFNSLVRKGTCR